MDPISTAAIAAALIAAQKGAEKLGDEAGQATWTGLGRLVTLIRARLGREREGSSALAAVEKQPNDSQAMAALGLALQHHMQRDAYFASELRALVTEAQSRGEVTSRVSIKAETIKAVFEGEVNVQGDLNIS